ncbi:MAG: ABC transporter permease [Nanoarchaeota archaeon]|nr:ABC transporter permease [Nanoarchaeota archaeon]
MSEYKYISPFLMKVSQVEYHGEVRFPTVVGMPPEDFDEVYVDMGIDVESGRMLRSGDGYSVIIGYRVANDMFEDELRVKNKIKINEKDFRVVGIMEEIGNPEDDNQLIIPLDTMRDLYDEPDKIDMIFAQAKPGVDMEVLQEKTEKRLENVRGNENFQVISPAQMAEQIGQILGIIQFILIGIAAISLIVGAVGIMNSMYTSVLERTKEIGIMKSVGARNSSILMLFLVESGLIGFIGGVIGVALGTGMALAVGVAASQAGFSMLKITIDYKILIFGLFFAVFIGMGSGVLPAYKASQLKPVDALRYE